MSVMQAAVPFAVIGSNTVIEVASRRVRGRMYPWGVVEVENPEHCDFIKLRAMLMYVEARDGGNMRQNFANYAQRF